MKKKLTKSQMTNIVLAVTLVVVVVFGYFYYLKKDPITIATNVVVPDAEAPYQFLYSITGKGQYVLSKPEGVVYGNNRIWVSDTLNQRIVVFDLNGEPMYEFGNKSNDKIKLKAPVGILIDNNRVFVCDMGLRNIVEYTLDGNLVGFFGEKNVPWPTVIDKYKDMYVVLDFAGPGLIFLDSNGEIVQRTQMGRGSAEGQAEFPQDIAVVGDRIYVADANNNRLQYTDDIKGPIKVAPVKEGSEPGIPHAMTAFNNQLFVGSATARAIRVYQVSEELQVKNLINAPDSQNIGLGSPSAVAIDDQGRVYVADVVHSRIMVYEKTR